MYMHYMLQYMSRYTPPSLSLSLYLCLLCVPFLPGVYVCSSKLDTRLSCSLLSALLPLGAELVEGLDAAGSKYLPIFKEYFSCVALLAGGDMEGGHLVLVKEVSKWLPKFVEVLKTRSSDWTESLLVPLAAIMQYLSHLTSAVQFSTNMVTSTAKRSLANLTDSIIQVQVCVL